MHRYLVFLYIQVVYTGPYSPLAQKYAPEMDGTRTWKAKYVDEDTSYALADTSFYVDVINDTTVRVWASQLQLSPFGVMVDITYFPPDTARCLLYGGNVGEGGAALEYYYYEDSIIFYYLKGGTRTIYYSYK